MLESLFPKKHTKESIVQADSNATSQDVLDKLANIYNLEAPSLLTLLTHAYRQNNYPPNEHQDEIVKQAEITYKETGALPVWVIQQAWKHEILPGNSEAE